MWIKRHENLFDVSLRPTGDQDVKIFDCPICEKVVDPFQRLFAIDTLVESINDNICMRESIENISQSILKLIDRWLLMISTAFI
jgi:hypothetical protein